MVCYDTIIEDGVAYGRTWTDDPRHKILVCDQTGERVGYWIAEILPHNHTYHEEDLRPSDFC